MKERKDPTKTFIGGLIIGGFLGLLAGVGVSAFYIDKVIFPLLLK